MSTSIRLQLVVAFVVCCSSRSPAQTSGPIPHPCLTMPQAHQFDFWIGQWDVTPWQVKAPLPTQQVGFNDVHPILEHCVLSENWKATRGEEASADGGKTWSSTFDGRYVKRH